MGAFLNCVVFLKISGLFREHKLPWNLLEKLGEVFKYNFLTAMHDLKRLIKAGIAKNNWCYTISERSLVAVSQYMHFYALARTFQYQRTSFVENNMSTA